MREIILDTETTGLDPASGHRIIEIGCVELIDRLPTENTYHTYINPNRPVDDGAVRVHGLTNEFLQDKPYFDEIYEAFFEFIKGASLVIHNASFDVGFIEHEFRRIDKKHPPLSTYCEIIDTLKMARDRHPGQRNNLDALCKRYGIDNSGRHYHGALLDADILAKVYLRMTGGQDSLFVTEKNKNNVQSNAPIKRITQHYNLSVLQATEEELVAHEAYIELLRERSEDHIEDW